MNFSEEILDQIERYLGQELTSDEVLDFEQKMEGDSELREMVDMQREIVSGIKKTAHLEFKKKLNGFHDQMPDSNKNLKIISRNKSRRRFLAIAASIALLILAGWAIFSNGSNREEVFAAPNKKPVLAEKYTVQATTNSETLDVLVYDWDKKEWKYHFQNQRFTLMLEEGTTIKKEDFKFFRNDKNELFVSFKGINTPIKSSNKLQRFKNE